MNAFMESLYQWQKEGLGVVMISVVKKQGEGPVEVGKKLIINELHQMVGTVGGGALEYRAVEEAKIILKTKQPKLETYLLHEGKVYADQVTLPMVCGGEVSLFYEYMGHQARVYLFGAGHVAKATAKILKTLPFHITVIDDRHEVIQGFEDCDQAVEMAFVPFIETIGIKEDAYVVVCTPSHQYDYHVINKVLEKQIKLRYIGMLCSPAKLADYLEKTKAQFGPSVDLSHFYSPIGLDLGGGSPAEIAISITSEILAIHHQRSTLRHMRENLHDSLRYW